MSRYSSNTHKNGRNNSICICLQQQTAWWPDLTAANWAVIVINVSCLCCPQQFWLCRAWGSSDNSKVPWKGWKCSFPIYWETWMCLERVKWVNYDHQHCLCLWFPHWCSGLVLVLPLFEALSPRKKGLKPKWSLRAAGLATTTSGPWGAPGDTQNSQPVLCAQVSLLAVKSFRRTARALGQSRVLRFPRKNVLLPEELQELHLLAACEGVCCTQIF